jgi:hypothetical protein
MTTRVVRLKRRRGEIMQGCDVYIGRLCNNGGWSLDESKWHNPFSMNDYTRYECVEKYREYITKKIEEDPSYYNIEELRGKTLGCWCKPNPCHGDVLVEIVSSRSI